MRITQNMMNEAARYNLGEMTGRLGKIQDQLLSQRRVQRPSDDPAAASAALGFQKDLASIAQHLESIDGANAWLNSSDDALRVVSDALLRAREIAVHGASDALSPSDRQALSQEAGQLIDHVMVAGNTSFGGRYLFAGHKTDQAPFVAAAGVAGGVAYVGDSGSIYREVEDRTTIAINVTGDSVFPEVFRTLAALRDGLDAGDHGRITGMIQDVDAAVDVVLAKRAQVGARVNRLEETTAKLESRKISVAESLSKKIDTDITEAISDYSAQQTVYQAALRISARSLQPSLLDYLR